MSSTDRPNILVVMSDDHGQWAAGCYGADAIHSPTLDYLAATGARCDQAFTPCPVCSPARASFWTGLIPSQHGIHDHLEEPGLAHDHPGLSDFETLGTLLHGAGYQTAMIGKWHCGRSWEPAPGFDEWFSYAAGQRYHSGTERYSDNGRIVERDGYHSEVFTQQALRFLNGREHDRPFFLYLGYRDTHSPFEGQPERLVERHRPRSFDPRFFERLAACHGLPALPGQRDLEGRQELLAQYFAAVEHIDQQLGRVIDHLQALGELDNTLIVYTADHGHMTGRHGLITKGNASCPQNFIDDSIRVPLLARWPGGGVPAGTATDAMTDHTDLHCTLLDAAGCKHAPVGPGVESPGKSFLPVLRGRAKPGRDACFFEYANARAIRTATEKLIVRYPGVEKTFRDEFYDLEADPWERENRIDWTKYRSRLETLGQQLDDFFSRYAHPQRTGLRAAELPRCNGREVWRMTSAEAEQIA